jgi:NAD+ synthase (glutamine-hydrolysing)
VPGSFATVQTVDLLGQKDIPFGNRLLFRAENQPLLTFYVEICEDVWVPIPPSSHAALAGATVIINLSASNITVGKADYRRQLVSSQSSRCLAAYIYSAAGSGESTTDLAWDGHGLICDNGVSIAETNRFAYGPQLATGDIDLDRLTQDRMRQTTFTQSVERHREQLTGFRTVGFELDLPVNEVIPLNRSYERFPFVPSEASRREERCREVYEIQVQGLVKGSRRRGPTR